MAKQRTVFVCTDCGGTAPQWQGKCPSCGAWNTLVEERVVPASTQSSISSSVAVPVRLGDLNVDGGAAIPTGIDELDRVLAGGLVPGSVTLVGGEPGIGKSTLLLQALSSMAAAGARCLLVTGEESTQQVRVRAERLCAMQDDLWLVSETSLPAVLKVIDDVKPDVVVIDSIQTMFDPEIGSAPGSVSQTRDCAAQLVRVAKEREVTVLLVGHVTKDGTLAGPRVLEHIVDSVVSFEGDRHHALRLVRAMKHRFGATGELGIFEMTEQGLVGIPDAGGILLADRQKGASGSVVVSAMEGHRPLLVEVQALVTESTLAQPRRSASGVDGNRLSLILAVLQRRVGISLSGCDVYVSAVGGIRLAEPAADLAVAIALASAAKNVALDERLVTFGEIGLGGELRNVSNPQRRITEAGRLGLDRVVMPRSSVPDDAVGAIGVATLTEALLAVGIRA